MLLFGNQLLADCLASWTKFKIVNPKGNDIRLLCLMGQEEVVIFKDDEKLVMYNLREGTLKGSVVHGIEDDLHGANEIERI